MPVVINISVGYVYGAHDGLAWYEQAIEKLSKEKNTIICVGTGNEGDANGYKNEWLRKGEEKQLDIKIQEYERNVIVQIWMMQKDEIDISVINPAGIEMDCERYQYYQGNKKCLCIRICSDNIQIDRGIWKLCLKAGDIVDGNVDIWLPSYEKLQSGTGFLQPDMTQTLTAPSTVEGVISVGAYDLKQNKVADFSGRGIYKNRKKPEVFAPGVHIKTAAVGGGYKVVSGTSFSTPYVSGIMAKWMEWGILCGNDSLLYGERAKEYLEKWKQVFLTNSKK